MTVPQLYMPTPEEAKRQMDERRQDEVDSLTADSIGVCWDDPWGDGR